MIFLKILLFGLLQALMGFLPVSSSGVLCTLEHQFGVDLGESTLFFHAFLRMGAALALGAALSRDRKVVSLQVNRITSCLVHNIRVFFSSVVGRASSGYKRVPNRPLTEVVLFFGAMLFGIALSSSFLLPLHVYFSDRPVFTGAAFMLTSVFLLVADMIPSRKTGFRDLPLPAGVFVGLLQGFGLLPGLSFIAIGVCALCFLGISKRKAVTAVLLVSIPVPFACALLTGARLVFTGVFTWKVLGISVLGMLFSFIFSLFTVKAMIKFFKGKKLLLFALLSFVLGVAVICLG